MSSSAPISIARSRMPASPEVVGRFSGKSAAVVADAQDDAPLCVAEREIDV